MEVEEIVKALPEVTSLPKVAQGYTWRQRNAKKMEGQIWKEC